MSSSGSSQPSYSPQPPSETSAPPPYTSPCGVPDRMISPDDAINSLLDENLPKPVEHRKNADKLPFPGNAAGHGNTQLPRYSQIEVLSPTGNESVGNPPAYPGNSAEFIQPPAPNNALQMVYPPTVYCVFIICACLSFCVVCACVYCTFLLVLCVYFYMCLCVSLYLSVFTVHVFISILSLMRR